MKIPSRRSRRPAAPCRDIDFEGQSAPSADGSRPGETQVEIAMPRAADRRSPPSIADMPRRRSAMRLILVVALFPAAVAACTPAIPVKPDFGTSALKPTENIPPEFVEFNNYDPAVNTLLADQMCATPYILDTERTRDAVPGQTVAAKGRCETHIPFFGN
jgi:hypothetical protein